MSSSTSPSKEFSIIAILYPKKGKTDQVLSLLQTHSLHVQTSEPFVLKYEIHRSLRLDSNGEEEIVMVERYQDQNGLKTHGTSREFIDMNEKLVEKDLMRAPMMVKMVGMKGGFSSRL